MTTDVPEMNEVLSVVSSDPELKNKSHSASCDLKPTTIPDDDITTDHES